jgi:hypothetical protein
MKDNTELAYNGTEVYTNAMQYYADEYITTLNKPDDIYTSNVFTGLIKYIRRNIKFNKDIYESIDVLNDIWEMYTELVYKYMQKPTIEEFSLLIGIHRDTIYSWMNGETRKSDYSERLGTSRSDTIKKWQDECRLGRYKSAASGNVGGIFLCKAVDGMVETAPIPVANQEQHRTAEQIAADYSTAGALPGDVQPDF